MVRGCDQSLLRIGRQNTEQQQQQGCVWRSCRACPGLLLSLYKLQMHLQSVCFFYHSPAARKRKRMSRPDSGSDFRTLVGDLDSFLPADNMRPFRRALTPSADHRPGGCLTKRLTEFDNAPGVDWKFKIRMINWLKLSNNYANEGVNFAKCQSWGGRSRVMDLWA